MRCVGGGGVVPVIQMFAFGYRYVMLLYRFLKDL